MRRPLLEVVTRHRTDRPDLFYRCKASLTWQSDRNFVQTVIEDDEGRGLEWANGQLAEHDPVGDYVWVLDDDDVCTHKHLVRDVREMVTLYGPDVIMAKNDLMEWHGILPDAVSWMAAPAFTHVAMSCFIVERDVWNEYRHLFRGREGADYRFLAAVHHDPNLHIHWWDEVIMRIQRKSFGMGQPA